MTHLIRSWRAMTSTPSPTTTPTTVATAPAEMDHGDIFLGDEKCQVMGEWGFVILAVKGPGYGFDAGSHWLEECAGIVQVSNVNACTSPQFLRNTSPHFFCTITLKAFPHRASTAIRPVDL
ncbi:hypothetical protein C1H46_043030 [Malus baccata]|uniref:Uncharacterized protein n=1 Tax=Malus baccata TaxID=106549 RepID=A0A540KB47_MALBA|nr:hypothetical protein C1H46_043030 [Malus baccata]